MVLRFLYTARAKKELRSVPSADREKIVSRVEAYAADPDAPQHDVRSLVNMPIGYRLRVGDWRVLFDIEDNEMHICRVVHRREAYR